eukprot:c6085_g1_i2.p2 GENE.c6085_g1_i2~~c6085_g1_i2.p2  ORF type:complete len:223 (-),score=42.24 c6085_g1_i2:374-1003(-)
MRGIFALFAFVSTLLLSTFAEDTIITCGSVIKLKHANSGRRLHSHDVSYGSGSGQQSVTGFDGLDDTNSMWVVKGPFGHDCPRGTAIRNNDVIRLEHMNTQKNLHSHLFPSPISNKQEVSAFGQSGNGDLGDNWKVECKGRWRKGKKIKLLHVETQKYLTADSRFAFPRPIAGQLEISCANNKDIWQAEEGVYFSPLVQERADDGDDEP